MMPAATRRSPIAFVPTPEGMSTNCSGMAYPRYGWWTRVYSKAAAPPASSTRMTNRSASFFIASGVRDVRLPPSHEASAFANASADRRSLGGGGQADRFLNGMKLQLADGTYPAKAGRHVHSQTRLTN